MARGEPINPRQLADAAQSTASQLLGMSEKDRVEIMRGLKKQNPTFHSLVQQSFSELINKTRGRYRGND